MVNKPEYNSDNVNNPKSCDSVIIIIGKLGLSAIWIDHNYDIHSVPYGDKRCEHT